MSTSPQSNRETIRPKVWVDDCPVVEGVVTARATAGATAATGPTSWTPSKGSSATFGVTLLNRENCLSRTPFGMGRGRLVLRSRQTSSGVSKMTA
jgi:hypothetical protein